jgi:hypothetical protein
VRSNLSVYSEDGSRRRGVACFVRAMADRGRLVVRENLDDSAELKIWTNGTWTRVNRLHENARERKEAQGKKRRAKRGW